MKARSFGFLVFGILLSGFLGLGLPSDTSAFHQPHTIQDGAVIQAEDYKLGGEGVGFHDTTPNENEFEFSNDRRCRDQNGNLYRSDDGADLGITKVNGHDDCKVGETSSDASEFTVYAIDVKEAGTYDIFALLTSGKEPGNIHIELDGHDITGHMRLENACGWHCWQEVGASGIQLETGPHELKVVRHDDLDFDSLRFARQADPEPEPEPEPVECSVSLLLVSDADDKKLVLSVAASAGNLEFELLIEGKRYEFDRDISESIHELDVVEFGNHGVIDIQVTLTPEEGDSCESRARVDTGQPNGDDPDDSADNLEDALG